MAVSCERALDILSLMDISPPNHWVSLGYLFSPIIGIVVVIIELPHYLNLTQTSSTDYHFS